MAPAPGGLSPQDVASAIEEALEEHAVPSTADAYEVIRPSVVRVRGLPEPGAGELEGFVADESVGTGVVIVEDGTILTNLHVVQGAQRLSVTFFDGSESEAAIVGARPEHDLAVIRAKTLPDDLAPATMRSTADLAPGETVVAVGFPFGIGPSASAGVVSGLKREYVSPSGGKLSNLIQFDAAVNPGNSGGPLVTVDGEVVGIVTGLLNPTEARVFIGIGFAVPIENAAGAAGLSPF
jgi:S1-C subfamily serine protease